MLDLDIVIVGVGICIGLYLWYRLGGKKFLDQYELQNDGGSP
jgi:hypothetical protein